MYIYQDKNWPDFRWDEKRILNLLAKVKLEQGRLLGKMQSLGFRIQDEALLQTLTEEILKSSRIEGEFLDIRQVRSSIARKLGITNADKIPSTRNIDGFVNMMYDATHNFDTPISKKRLCTWHAQMFPDNKSGMYKIKTGCYRDDKLGPMQVVSGPMGMEKVHYQAPDADILEPEMERFIKFVNDGNSGDGIIKAAIAHLWFVILHPFDDGNGRIARALTEMLLAKSENFSGRFYSMSSQIEKHRKTYYEELKITQGGSLDITAWLEWFLNTLLAAIAASGALLKTVLAKAYFWKKHQDTAFNSRQKKMLNMLLDGFEGHLTSSKWAKITKTSQDTAGRDIVELINLKILKKIGDGRSTHYALQ
jgi:Fic family protein